MMIGQTEVKFTLEIGDIPRDLRLKAEHKAREAYVMELLRHHDIRAGMAAKLLAIDRWQLSNLMDEYRISPFPEYTREELRNEVNETLHLLEKHQQ